jgi:hypothetical protein
MKTKFIYNVWDKIGELLSGGFNFMYIITLKLMTEAIKNKLGLDENKSRKIARFIMDIFGYETRIIDNILNPEERQLFYMLEAEGFLITGREQTRLYDGREWMTHYWQLRKTTIIKFTNSNNVKLNTSIIKSSKEIVQPQNVYSTLSDDMWLMRKILDQKSLGQI